MKIHIKHNLLVSLLAGSMLLSGCLHDEESDPASTLNSFFFIGETNESGDELWKSDGSEDGTVMVKEINAQGHSHPKNFTQLGATVFFTATDGVNGYELWKADSSGVALVKDIYPAGNSNPGNLVAHNNKLYFTAYDGITTGLWESDGSEAGTTQIGAYSDVSDITPMPDGSLYFTANSKSLLVLYNAAAEVPLTEITTDSSNFRQLTAVGSSLFFVGYTAASGYELWSSTDGATASMILEIGAATASGLDPNYTRLFDVDGVLLFNAYQSSLYSTLWTSGGSAATTQQLLNNAATYNVYNYNPMVQASTGEVYYYNGSRTWRSDGTVANTMQVTNKVNAINYFVPDNNGNMYFIYNSDLWVTDGTDAGTTRLYQDPQNHNDVEHIAIAGNKVYFRTDHDQYGLDHVYVLDNSNNPVQLLQNNFTINIYGGGDKLYLSYRGETGSEPWQTDGTAANTVAMANVNTTILEDSDPHDKAVIGDVLYFTAQDGVNGRALWKTQGGEADTVRVSKGFNSIYSVTASGGKIYFVAADEDYGTELWVSDGTEAGTHIVIDMDPGVYGSYPYALTDVNGTLYFTNDDNGYLWKTDGSLQGTTIVSFSFDYSNKIYSAGNNIYFKGYLNNDEELWVTDGTLAGSHVLKDINPTDDGIVDELHAAAIGNILYFTADDGNGIQLWKTDGTEEGTQLAVSFNEGDDWIDDDSPIYSFNGQLYFMAYTDNGDYELWTSDGTQQGTIALTALNDIGGMVDEWNGFAYRDGMLYFAADDDNDYGKELWISDGTVEGTAMLLDINPDGSNSNPYGFQTFGDYVFFFANNGTHGTELWRTDGTAEGTVMVKDINTDENDSGADQLCGSLDPCYEDWDWWD